MKIKPRIVLRRTHGNWYTIQSELLVEIRDLLLVIINADQAGIQASIWRAIQANNNETAALRRVIEDLARAVAATSHEDPEANREKVA